MSRCPQRQAVSSLCAAGNLPSQLPEHKSIIVKLWGGIDLPFFAIPPANFGRDQCDTLVSSETIQNGGGAQRLLPVQYLHVRHQDCHDSQNPTGDRLFRRNGEELLAVRAVV